MKGQIKALGCHKNIEPVKTIWYKMDIFQHQNF